MNKFSKITLPILFAAIIGQAGATQKPSFNIPKFIGYNPVTMPVAKGDANTSIDEMKFATANKLKDVFSQVQKTLRDLEEARLDLLEEGSIEKLKAQFIQVQKDIVTNKGGSFSELDRAKAQCRLLQLDIQEAQNEFDTLVESNREKEEYIAYMQNQTDLIADSVSQFKNAKVKDLQASLEEIEAQYNSTLQTLQNHQNSKAPLISAKTEEKDKLLAQQAELQQEKQDLEELVQRYQNQKSKKTKTAKVQLPQTFDAPKPAANDAPKPATKKQETGIQDPDLD